MSHSVGQPLQFETCRSCHRSLSQKRFPKNKATGKGKPERWGSFGRALTSRALSRRVACTRWTHTPGWPMYRNGSTHPARDVAQLTPRLWKENFAANPLTSDIGKGVLEPALKSAA